MTQLPYLNKIVAILAAGFIFLTIGTSGRIGQVGLKPPIASAANLYEEYGVIGAVPSLASDSQKQAAIDKIAESGYGWMRHEFHYENPVSFEHYDAAQAKAKTKGIKTLGLLVYPGNDKSHDDWKNYVRSVVSHFGSEIPAWEIMNEADNYLSGADYVVYLNEARDIIRSINSGATIVLSGITSRPETPNFWNGVAAAGGWGSFDVIGLHVYHSGNPERVNFGGGDLLAEYDRALASIKKNGGGKKIWITETGYKASQVGNEDQANWLARTLIMSRSVPTIEKIFIYRLYDDSKDTYGLLGADLSPRPAYERVKAVISNLGGKGNGTRLYPQSRQTLDGLESVNGWTTQASSNGTLGLSTVTGKTGNGMKLDYHFSADKAYVVAEKSMPINGTPEALAAWFYGDDTKNVWKYRFKDSKGETFQADLGNLVSGWNYKQFTIGQDTAYVSWDGDNKIDFPISFHALVVDRQEGEAQASGIVDEISAITSGADLFAFQFGTSVAYWKVLGSASAELCEAKRDFSSSPSYAHEVSCTDTPKSSPTTGPKATTAPATAPPSASPSPKTGLDVTKSLVRVDGENILADGTTAYRIVTLLRDTNNGIVKDRKPTVTVMDGSATTLTSPTLVGDEWWVTATATEPGTKKIRIVADGLTIKEIGLAFVAVATPSPSSSPLVSPTSSPILPVTALPTKPKTPSIIVLARLFSAGSALLLTGLLLWQKFGARLLMWWQQRHWFRPNG